MKIRQLIALTLCLALALSACGQRGGSQSGSSESTSSAETSAAPQTVTPIETNALSLAWYSREGLHPYTCSSAVNQMVTHLIYEPLFEIDNTFSPTPCLAKSYSFHTDGISPTCIIKLRKNIQFSNGNTLSVADVVYSLEQARQPKSIYANHLSNIKAIHTQGNKVVLTLKEEDTAFASLLNIPIIQNDSGGKRYPVGTGPYQVRQKKGKAQSLTRNKNWWQESKLPVEEVGLYPTEDSDMLIFGFGSGAVSLVQTDLTGTESLAYTGQYNVVDYPTTTLLYLGCNTRTGSCRNANFRQVMTYAADRETLTRKMLSGHAEPTILPISPRSSLYDEELASKYEYSEEKAKKALKETYYEGSTLILIVNSESTFKTALASELKKELEEIGIQIEVRELAWKDFADALKKRNFDLYLGEVRLNDQFDLTELVTKGGKLNYGGYKDKALEKLLYQMKTAKEENRSQAAKEVYQAMVKKAVIIPLCFKNHSILTHWSTDAELTPTQQNPFYQFKDWNLRKD